MTRGELSALTGVSARTIRFYEEKGILPSPVREDNGYRNYDKAAVIRLKFIKNAKDLGFSLKEIKELLELKVSPGVSCESIRRKAAEKIGEIEKKISDLEKIKDALKNFTRYCRPGKSVEECELINLLEG